MESHVREILTQTGLVYIAFLQLPGYLSYQLLTTAHYFLISSGGSDHHIEVTASHYSRR